MLSYKCSLTKHGERQFELDIEYPVPYRRKRAAYQLDMYLFCPYQLGMTKERYGVARFLQHFFSYTRHTIPAIPLDRLVEDDCEKSPLIRITQALDSMSSAGEVDEKYLLYELRMFANVYHQQVKGTRNLLKDLLADGLPEADFTLRIRTFLGEIDAVLKKFRVELRQKFMDANLSDSLRRSADWVDEKISLSTQKQLLNLYSFCQQHAMNSSGELLRQYLQMEDAYHKSRGFETVVEPGSDAADERFVYYESMLKKWTESCLYMSVVRNRLANRITQILLGVAAGGAMLFAVSATFLATKWFPPDSVAWAILIVIMYIFKDRIKEWLRAFFIAVLPKMVSDRTEELIDPKAGQQVGSSKIRVRMMPAGETPPEVRRLRYLTTNKFRDILPPEDVIELHKETRFDCELLSKFHKRLESITEIARFRLDAFLANMDDPFNTLGFIRNGKYEEVQAKRIYHVHVIIGLREDQNENNVFFHYLLAANRDGIIRIEFVRKA